MSQTENNRDHDEALEEFSHIVSHTEGAHGCRYSSSNGYEFVIWIDDGNESPQPDSDLIEIEVDREDETCEGHYKFSMTLPYASRRRGKIMGRSRTKITTSAEMDAVVGALPGDGGQASKYVMLIDEALRARGIICSLPTQRGKYPRHKAKIEGKHPQ